MENVKENEPAYYIQNSEIDDQGFSLSDLKLLNLIAELVVNISIRESYEKGN